MYIKRHIESQIEECRQTYPAVLVTGPRQVGKSTVLKELYPRFAYETLDDLNMVQMISSDPLGYLQLKGTPFVIDEIQKAPKLFGSIKYMIDGERKNGMYLFTGSQKFELMKGVSESLAGRIAVIDLLGLSLREINGDAFCKPFIPTMEYLSARKPEHIDIKRLWEIIHRGSMPALYENEYRAWSRYYADYVSTYIERDVRELSQVGDTLAFMQFLTALASRTGELLNMNAIAQDIGVSAPTIKRWIAILQASNIIYLLQPFSLNSSKRVVKTPKVYFTDTGLVCYLCKWLTPDTLANGAQAGNIFETFVVDEILKSYLNAGEEANLYFFRNTDGQEVDLIIYQDGKIFPIEIKKTSSPNLKDIKHFGALKNAFPMIELAEGGVICTSNTLLPLGEGNKVIPISYI